MRLQQSATVVRHSSAPLRCTPRGSAACLFRLTVPSDIIASKATGKAVNSSCSAVGSCYVGVWHGQRVADLLQMLCTKCAFFPSTETLDCMKSTGHVDRKSPDCGRSSVELGRCGIKNRCRAFHVDSTLDREAPKTGSSEAVGHMRIP